MYSILVVDNYFIAYVFFGFIVFQLFSDVLEVLVFLEQPRRLSIYACTVCLDAGGGLNV